MKGECRLIDVLVLRGGGERWGGMGVALALFASRVSDSFCSWTPCLGMEAGNIDQTEVCHHTVRPRQSF